MAAQGSAAPGALTDEDVAAVRDDVSAGKTVTVWFTAAAVGVPAGGSAKVVAVGDIAEGDFIQVRPAGSRDALFCSPGELTRSRPARRPASSRQRREKAPDEATTPQETPTLPSSARRADRPSTSTSRAPSVPAPDVPGTPDGTVERSPRKPRARRRVEHPGPLTVNLTSTVEGEWTVEVLAGTRKIVTPTPVPATDVAAVSRSLPPAVAEAMMSALAEARRQQEERVAHLRAELDAAQRTLEQFRVD